MTDRAHSPAVLAKAIAVDPTRIPSAPPGVPSYRDEIASAAATIAARFDPDRVVLFGSRASGTPRPNSDIDLMVVTDTTVSPDAHAQSIRRAADVDLPVRLQVLVRHPDDIASRLAEGDFFIQDVMLDGITLYARDGMVDPPSPPDNAPRNPVEVLTQATRDWLAKAAEDESAARHLLTSPIPIHGLVCFHAQQSAEKNLTGLLQQYAIRFPRTNDLVELAALALPLVPDLASPTAALKDLTDCSVDARYPGATAGAAQADAALRTMTTVREFVTAALGSLEGDQA